MGWNRQLLYLDDWWIPDQVCNIFIWNSDQTVFFSCSAVTWLPWCHTSPHTMKSSPLSSTTILYNLSRPFCSKTGLKMKSIQPALRILSEASTTQDCPYSALSLDLPARMITMPLECWQVRNKHIDKYWFEQMWCSSFSMVQLVTSFQRRQTVRSSNRDLFKSIQVFIYRNRGTRYRHLKWYCVLLFLF